MSSIDVVRTNFGIEQVLIYRIPHTFLPLSAAPRAVVSAPTRTCTPRAMFCAQFVNFAAESGHGY